MSVGHLNNWALCHRLPVHMGGSRVAPCYAVKGPKILLVSRKYWKKANGKSLLRLFDYHIQGAEKLWISSLASKPNKSQMAVKYAAEILKWHHVNVKIGRRDVIGNVAGFILNKWKSSIQIGLNKIREFYTI